MIAEFLKPSDPRWRDLLSHVPHDFYHLPEYVSMCADFEGGDPVAFYAEDEGDALLIPLLLRKIPAELGAEDSWWDVVSPYGYPSPLLFADDAAAPRRLNQFMGAFFSMGRESGLVSVFLRLHPLYELPRSGLFNFGQLVRHGQTVKIDLTLPDEELQRQTRENHRKGIRNLKKSGFTVSMDDWDYFDDFFRLYHQTMQRLHASRQYYFSAEYFAALREALGEKLHLAVVLSPCAEPAAAGLFVAEDGTVEYHLAGTAEQYLHDAPSKLMFDHVRDWAKQYGQQVFHLGGGVGGNSNDSLFNFKVGFSKLTADFFTFRGVFDFEKYTRLTKDCGSSGEGDRNLLGGYFPAYRGTAALQ